MEVEFTEKAMVHFVTPIDRQGEFMGSAEGAPASSKIKKKSFN